LSKVRAKYEEENQTVLPHTGTIQDMGSTVTHKKQIVYKHVVQGKDPKKVAYETNHSQLGVDRYIKDFYRVKTLVDDGKDIDYIHLATNISKHVIIQYQQILDQYVKEH
jgi:FixJ family two-component response regulator